jgi:rubrerythrin
MANFESVDAVLDFAIEKEQEAYDFYTDLAGKMSRPGMAQIFKEFAAQEKGHKAKLEAVKQGKTLEPSAKSVQDLKIADYTVDVDASPQMDYQDALILAMKREKAAFKLYNDLAEASEELRDTFLALAQEEAKHKLRIEIEYDDKVLGEN